MSDPTPNHDALISEFCSFTGGSSEEARHYLTAHDWVLEAAAAEYYMAIEENTDRPEPQRGGSVDTDDTAYEVPKPAGGDRTLGGDFVPRQGNPTTSSSAAPPPPSKKKFATLGDLGEGGAGHAGHGHDDDDDDSDEAENQDLFAGGEKSALAVQNPAEDLKRKILEKARKNRARPGGDDPQPVQSRFTGTARTLGGDDTPSQIIPDPSASVPRRPARVERRLHFWADGFSVDDGPLYRSDDPANAEILAMIRSGRAPLEIMNVSQAQEVDVKVEQHPEKYVAPKKKYNPFGGGGQRLGSPVPGQPSPELTPTTTPVPAAMPTRASGPQVDVNEAEPTISLQIRLGDGTRLASRFNASHTIGDVYSFVAASTPASNNRSWVLMTTFPSKELSNHAVVLGDLAEFKRGGVVVQKWTN